MRQDYLLLLSFSLCLWLCPIAEGISLASKVLAACTASRFCVGNTFTPYNNYRIVEGRVSPYQLGFFRMHVKQFTAAPIEPFVDNVCASNRV